MQEIANNIIDALGGTTAVSRLTATPLSTVHSWRKIGIPASRLAHLRLAAEADGKGEVFQRALAGDGGEADHAADATAATAAPSSGNTDHLSGAEVAA